MTVIVRVEVDDGGELEEVFERFERVLRSVERVDVFRMMLNRNLDEIPPSGVERYSLIVDSLKVVDSQVSEIFEKLDVGKAIKHLEVIP
ncbi:hypothetical protein JCM16307_22560 [Thermococcus prieurii]